MDGMRVLDDPQREWVNASDEAFCEVSARIGEKTVQSFKAGCVIEAAAAVWAEVFVPRRDVIPGSDGNAWAIEREFTFELWVEVLYCMPKGKAVGVSGFSVELLVAHERGGAVQRAFYDALMRDLQAKRIPATWRVVIYALLVKPPLNNPEIVAERREIALMEQDMKLTLMLANVTAYERVLGRVDPTNGEGAASLPTRACACKRLCIRRWLPDETFGCS